MDCVHGDEWIVLDGLHPTLPRIASQLPSLGASAVVISPHGKSAPLLLRGELLSIDADAMTAALVWRGLWEHGLTRVVPLHIAVTIGPPSELAAMGRRAPQALENATASSDVDETLVPTSAQVAGALARPVAPFAVAPPSERAPGEGLNIPGAPWSVVAAPRSATDPVDETLAIPCLSELARNEPSSVRIVPKEHCQLSAATGASPTPAAAEFAPNAFRESPSAEPPPEAGGRSLRDRVSARIRDRQSLGGLNLKGADLEGLNLDGVSLSGLDLSHARLVRCSLRGAQLSGATLTGADLSEAVLVRADVVRANLRNAVLRGADFEEAALRDANLERASCDDARFVRADLSRANLAYVTASRADFSHAVLKEAELKQAKLQNANIEGASLRDALATRIDLSHASGENVDLRGAMLRDGKLCRAKLRSAKLDGADLQGADLTEADLRGAPRSGAKLFRANTHGWLVD